MNPMIEERPHFSEHVLGEKKPKKITPRQRRRIKTPANQLAVANPKIDECLTSIYQDERGAIPDMRTIAVKKEHRIGNFFLRLICISVVCSALGWILWYYWPQLLRHSENQATLTIVGPDHPPIGQSSTYTLSYENREKIDLHDVLLQLHPAAGFIIDYSSLTANNDKKTEWTIGILPAKGSGTLTITGRQFGTPHQAASWRAALKYQSEKITSFLEEETSLPITLGPAPVTLTISGPAQNTLGSAVTYTFQVAAKGGWPREPLEIVPEFPVNFSLSSSSPALTKNHWIIPTPSSTTPFNVVITGQWHDSTTTEPIIRAGLFWSVPSTTKNFLVEKSEFKSEVIKNDINLSIAINGTTTDFDSKPGDLINTTFQLQNNSGHEIKNAILGLSFEAPALKRQSLLNWPEITNPADADIQGEQLSDTRRRGTLTWSSKHLPALAQLPSGKEASLDIRLPIRDSKNFALESVRDTTITVRGTATFSDQTGTHTILSNPITITVNSDLTFEQRSAVSVTPEGKKRFAISWILNNTFHALKNIDLSATLYGDINWEANGDVSSGVLTYDAAAKKLTWHIAELPTTVDVASAPFTVSLNSNNPTQSLLISKIRIQADDTVTGKKIELLGDEVPLNK